MAHWHMYIDTVIRIYLYLGGELLSQTAQNLHPGLSIEGKTTLPLVVSTEIHFHKLPARRTINEYY